MNRWRLSVKWCEDDKFLADPVFQECHLWECPEFSQWRTEKDPSGLWEGHCGTAQNPGEVLFGFCSHCAELHFLKSWQSSTFNLFSIYEITKCFCFEIDYLSLSIIPFALVCLIVDMRINAVLVKVRQSHCEIKVSKYQIIILSLWFSLILHIKNKWKIKLIVPDFPQNKALFWE